WNCFAPSGFAATTGPHCATRTMNAIFRAFTPKAPDEPNARPYPNRHLMAGSLIQLQQSCQHNVEGYRRPRLAAGNSLHEARKRSNPRVVSLTDGFVQRAGRKEVEQIVNQPRLTRAK